MVLSRKSRGLGLVREKDGDKILWGEAGGWVL